MNNIISMCKDRDYKEIKPSEYNYSAGDRSSSMENILTAVTSGNVKVLVFRTYKMGIDVIRLLVQDDDLHGCHLILIYDKDITSFSKKHLKICKNFTYELHCYSFFMINPTKHQLVPKHEMASKEDMDMLIKKTGSLNNLPKLLNSDPIARWFAFDKGEIVKIHRPTPTGMHMKVYRLVV